LTRAFRLASPANFPAPPSYRPATVIACRSSSLPSDRTSSLRLPPIFRLSLPVRFQLAPSANVSALPSNLTSDSHRLLHPLGAALQLIFDRRRRSTFLPCQRTQPPTPIVHCVPSALPSSSPSAFAADQLSGLACGPSPQLLVCRIPSALPSGFPSAFAADQPSSPPCGSNLRLIDDCVLRRCVPANPRLASPINLPAGFPIFL